MWSWILSVGTTFSQPLFSISLASVCIEVFPFLKWHTTTSTGFSCHYIRKIKWLIILEINSQLKSAAFKYSACKHEKLQHFGNVHRMKTSGRRHSVTWYQTFCVKTYFNIAFLVTHISQIKSVYLYFERKSVMYTLILNCKMFHARRPPYTYDDPNWGAFDCMVCGPHETNTLMLPPSKALGDWKTQMYWTCYFLTLKTLN